MAIVSNSDVIMSYKIVRNDGSKEGGETGVLMHGCSVSYSACCNISAILFYHWVIQSKRSQQDDLCIRL